MDITKMQIMAGILPAPTEQEKLQDAIEEAKKDENHTTNIEDDTEKNKDFREVLHTTEKTQLVLMCLKPGEDIGMETHKDGDQFIRIESGDGKSVLDGKEEVLEDGSSLVIAAGTEHNIINTSDTKDMKLYALYSPPEHDEGATDKDKPKD